MKENTSIRSVLCYGMSDSVVQMSWLVVCLPHDHCT